MAATIPPCGQAPNQALVHLVYTFTVTVQIQLSWSVRLLV